MAMVKKSVVKLREKAPYVLKRKGHAKQKKKLLKAYHGKRLNESIRAHAAFEEMTISEMKKMEFDFYRDMKGGHHHRRNYCICSVCGKWFRRNNGIHDENESGPLHFCDMICKRQAEFESCIDADVGGYFEHHYWDEEEDAEWRKKKCLQ
jgi:hypothetical protein